MKLDTANKILSNFSLPTVRSIHKLDVGFSNAVYQLGNDYILKLCTDIANNEPSFRNEARLYDYYREKLPVPHLITYNESKSLIKYSFMLYKKIAGNNLYDVWHTLSTPQKKMVIKQLCDLLLIINQTNPDDLPGDMKLERVENWKTTIVNKIEKYLAVTQTMGTLQASEIETVKHFVRSHSNVLEQQKVVFVYWDVHFDNVLVRRDKIVGLLDLERTELASIDFVLDTVRRMVEFPKKYMSEKARQYAKDDDYRYLLSWYKEFYPQLFTFDRLNTRLDLYSIAHDLEDLENWPNVQSLKDNILRITRKY